VTLYAILELPPGATREELHARGKSLSGLWHPDRADGGDVERYKELQEAYAVLKNDEARALYDRRLRMDGVNCPACAGAGRVQRTLSFTRTTQELCAACAGTGRKEEKK